MKVKSSDSRIVHEKQKLQLCAIHTVNNLLQLRPPTESKSNELNRVSSKNNENENSKNKNIDENQLHWHCGTLWIKTMKGYMPYATKNEFDRIACTMAVVENDILNNDNFATGRDRSSQRKASFLEKMWNNHGTPYFGNYSFEVLETALQNRGIELVRCNNQLLIDSNDNSDNSIIECLSLPTGNQEKQIAIGYIINTNDVSWFGHNIIQKIPGISGWNGNHWYAITRLYSIQAEDQILDPSPSLGSACSTLNNGAKWEIKSAEIPRAAWSILDSDSSQSVELSSDKELIEHLKAAIKGGDTIFQARLSM